MDKEEIKRRIDEILDKERGKTLEQIVNEYCDELAECKDDPELIAYALEKYQKIQEENSSGHDDTLFSQQMSDSGNHNQGKSGYSQESGGNHRGGDGIPEEIVHKINEHEQKLNNIIEVLQTLMYQLANMANIQGMGVTPGVNMSPQAQANHEQPISQSQPQQQVSPQDQVQAQTNQSQVAGIKLGAGNNPLTLEQIKGVLDSIAIITSNLGRRQAGPEDIISSITNSVGIATSIASSIGEGLAKLFDTFNRMQDRAFKSWALKAKAGVTEEDIEKLVEEKLMNVLSKYQDRGD